MPHNFHPQGAHKDLLIIIGVVIIGMSQITDCINVLRDSKSSVDRKPGALIY